MDIIGDTLSDNQRYTKNGNPSKYLFGKTGFILQLDYTPLITPADIDNGTITRYFGRKTNDATAEIIELDEKLYNNLKNSHMYITVKLPWRITGKIKDVYTGHPGGELGYIRTYVGVVSANKLATLEASADLAGLPAKLPDPLQYYQKE